MPRNTVSPYERAVQLFCFDQEQCPDGILVGIDEAGRGPWAGPVVAAAVAFPAGLKAENLSLLNDSKKLSAHQREILAERIPTLALTVGIGSASPREIDQLDIEKATFLAMRRALEDAGIIPTLLLVDGHRDPNLGFPTRCVVKGDGRSASIAAASILAKTTRDRHMDLLAGNEDRWGFRNHKGYGTEHHRHAIQVFGISEYHRRTFKPVSRSLFHTGPTGQFLSLWSSLNGLDGLPPAESVLSAVQAEIPHLLPDEAWILSKRLESLQHESLVKKTGQNLRDVGEFYETMVLRYLEKKGLTILVRNYHASRGEIDLIARDEDTLVFIEVKVRRRGGFGEASEAVDRRKQRNMFLAARAFLEGHPEDLDLRFDVIALDPDGKGGTHLTHYQSAFEVENGDRGCE
jgi:ribonuclease HII